MAAIYVQGRNTDTWHWCRNCSNYPTAITKRRKTKPTYGDLCNQCKGKVKNGKCRT
jgi:hypothetical protein